MSPTFVTILVLLCLSCLSLAAKSKSYDERRKRFILSQYRQLFRTPEQQREYAAKFFNLTMAPVPKKTATNPTNYNKFCKRYGWPFPIRPLNKVIRKQQAGPYDDPVNEPPKNHGCCTSQRFFSSPPTAICHETGANLTLVQCDPWRQYFLTQSCTEDPECTLDCSCEQEYAVYLALVENPRKPWPWSVREIRIPGCCKCLNNV